MPKFVAVLRQSGGGCDYTIGCGTSVHSIEADDLESAFEILKKRAYWESYDEGCDPQGLVSGERAISSATIYQVGKDDRGETFKDWILELEVAYDAAEQEATAGAELAEFERLKKKLGK